MPWIESHADLRGHPKFVALCDLLDLSEWEGIGLLHCWWWWAMKYVPTGDLAHFTDKQIARSVGWTRDAGELVAALTEAGFLNDDRSIHDWHTYAGRWIERREADAERNRLNRAKAKKERETRVAALAREQAHPADVRSTGPDRTGPDPTGPDVPPKTPPAAAGGGGAAAAADGQDDETPVLVTMSGDGGVQPAGAAVDSGAGPGPDQSARRPRRVRARTNGAEPAADQTPAPAVPAPSAPEAARIWDAGLGELRLGMSQANFESYLAGTTAAAFVDDELTVTVGNPLVRDTLEQRFRQHILRALYDVVGRQCRVKLVSGRAPPANGAACPDGGGGYGQVAVAAAGGPA